MNATTIGLIAVVIVFVVDIILLLGLVLLKAFHRRRTARHELRRAAYVATLSRHLASNQQTDRIDEAAADDDAFVDAVIDLRNVVSGREIETLTGLVDGLGEVAPVLGGDLQLVMAGVVRRLGGEEEPLPAAPPFAGPSAGAPAGGAA